MVCASRAPEAAITERPPLLPRPHQLVWLRLQREAGYCVIEPNLAAYFNCLNALWATAWRRLANSPMPERAREDSNPRDTG